ncbi:MAG: sugar ABC transporter permease [Chloroflexota bacterium]|nr:sugar ABC transporter permease [Chloroflexota bacterium]
MSTSAGLQQERFSDRVTIALARFFHISRNELNKRMFAYLALLPILAIYLLLRIIPIAQNFIYSFYDSSVVNPRENFVGFQNFIDLFNDHLFLISLRNTTFFAIFLTLFSVTIALGLAALLASKVRLGGWYEAIYFIPVITPMVPVAVVWKWIYDPTYGLLNYALSWIGVDPVGWLVYPDTAMWAIIIMSTWKVIGYNMVIFLVGIRAIPEVYFEAAEIDGASNSAIFRRITLPLLRPILLFVIVISTINAYNVFTQVFIMTAGPQGAPGNAVRTLVFDIYENAFRYFRTGYAASEAVVLFLIILVLTVIQFGVIRSD